VWGNKKNKHHGRISTIIGKGTVVKGDVNFSGGLHIDGHIIGNITSPEDESACITISEYGLIEGEVHIPNIIVNGQVKGDIYSSNHLELAKKSQIHGNVYYNIIEIAVGSEINGNLEHGQTAIEECDDHEALEVEKSPVEAISVGVKAKRIDLGKEQVLENRLLRKSS
jgi:cytoskeletal protein CcmA (bactofilin family)